MNFWQCRISRQESAKLPSAEQIFSLAAGGLQGCIFGPGSATRALFVDNGRQFIGYDYGLWSVDFTRVQRLAFAHLAANLLSIGSKAASQSLPVTQTTFATSRIENRSRYRVR
jgi:hypothetical protein